MPRSPSSGPRKRNDPLTRPYGITQPAHGTGTLWYDVIWTLSFGGRIHWRVNLNFVAKPWHTTGLQPFDWDFVQPAGAQVFPIVRVMALREVAILRNVERLSPGAPEVELEQIDGRLDIVDYAPASARPGGILRQKAPKNMGDYAVTYGGHPSVGSRAPLLQIIRPQIDVPVAHPDVRMRLHDLIATPYVVRPGLSTTNETKRDNRTVVITQHRTGMDFLQYKGRYKIEVRIIEPMLPAAFAYVLEDPESLERNDFQALILHSANVQITVKMQSGHHDKLRIGAKRYGQVFGFNFDMDAVLRSIAQVPRPGEEPDPDTEYNNSHVRFRRNVGSPGIGETLLDVFLDTLSIVPLIGDLYDVGESAYAAATGEDFRGRKVDHAELAVLGAAILLPVAIKGR